jgi:hypothetical protein
MSSVVKTPPLKASGQRTDLASSISFGPTVTSDLPKKPLRQSDGSVRSRSMRIVAYLCLAVGVMGLALPILPGIAFLLIGFKLLGSDHPLTRPVVRLIRRWRRKI